MVAAADAHTARLLDRAGKPLGQALPFTPLSDGRTALAVDLPIGPLSEGDYVIELVATRGDISERRLLAFRVVRWHPVDVGAIARRRTRWRHTSENGRLVGQCGLSFPCLAGVCEDQEHQRIYQWPLVFSDGVDPGRQRLIVPLDGPKTYGLSSAVSRLEHRKIQILHLRQMFHVVQIQLEIPRQFAQGEILRIECEESDTSKLAREHLRQAVRVRVRKRRHRDDLNVELVLAMQGAVSAGGVAQPACRGRRDLDHVQVTGGSRQSVVETDGKAANAVKRQVLRRRRIDICEERSPRFRRRLRGHTADLPREASSTDSNVPRRRDDVDGSTDARPL